MVQVLWVHDASTLGARLRCEVSHSFIIIVDLFLFICGYGYGATFGTACQSGCCDQQTNQYQKPTNQPSTRPVSQINIQEYVSEVWVHDASTLGAWCKYFGCMMQALWVHGCAVKYRTVTLSL